MLRNKRKLSPNERMYLTFEENYNSFAINRVVEGKGKIELDKLEKAIKKVANIFPETTYILKGRKLVCSEKLPKINRIEQSDIGERFENLLKRRIDLRKELACEILYLEKEEGLILVFRTHHSVMDGKGQGIWIEAIFKELNNIENRLEISSRTDYEILKREGREKSSDIVSIGKYNPIKRRESYDITTPISQIIEIDRKIPNLTAKLIASINKMSEDKKNRFIVTRDIRDKFLAERFNIGNLSLPLYLELDEKVGWEAVNKEIVEAIISNRDLIYSPMEYLIFDKIPIFILKYGLNRTIQKYNRQNLTASTSVISNLGKLEIKNYSTDSFVAEKIYALPVITPLVPISFVLTEVGEKTYITAGYYKGNFNDKAIDSYLAELKDELLNEKKIFIEGKKDVKKLDIFEKIFSHSEGEDILSYTKVKKESYKEIFKKANSLAHYLKSIGVEKGDRIAISTKRNSDYLISIIATLKLGAIFVPIDPDYPEERKEYIKTISKSKILLEDTERYTISEYNENLITKYIESDVVYIIFTSGSTGKPKGVEITYGTLCNYISNCIDKYEIDSDIIFGFFTSISFDLSITAIFTSLVVKGGIEFFDEKVEPASLREIFEKSRMNAVKMTPTHLEIISKYDILENRFKIVIVGGEQLKLSTAQKAQKLLGKNCKIINEYGPTEATVGCVYHIYDENQNYSSEGLPIGLPLDNIDLSLQIDKDTEIGELLIGGDCLAKGYYENREETEKKFIFVEGKRFYKSGDLCRINSEQQLEFLERKDFQIKIRGYRIELEEIEKKIEEINGVKGARVLPNSVKTGLVAYYIGEIEEKKIRDYLKDKLPDYMIPYSYFKIDEFPLNSNGKLDVKLLKERANENRLQEDKHIYLSEIEKKIIEIWERILEIDIPLDRINESFYELGADSLSIIRFINEIEPLINSSAVEAIIIEPTLKNIKKYMK